MSGSTFGKNFTVTTWGESHGPAIGVVVQGCPSGLKLSEKEIQHEVDRRRPQKGSKAATTRREKDKVSILSGVFEGKTTGTPISVIIENQDTRSKDYSSIKDKYRPGHADYTYDLKYGHRDYRGGGRSSGRETACRVIAGAIAKLILAKEKTDIFGHTVQIGPIRAEKFIRSEIEKNEVRCSDSKKAQEMIELIEKTRFQDGDTLGAIVEIIVKNPPKGLGDPVFDKLDAQMAKAMMSIGAVKGVEIGAGFHVVKMKGSENNDQMTTKNGTICFKSNHAGGILGGISTGEDIVIRLAIKPVPSTSIELETVTKKGKKTTIKTLGRHDCCLAPRIIPVAESMAAIVLADAYLTNTA